MPSLCDEPVTRYYFSVNCSGDQIEELRVPPVQVKIVCPIQNQ